MSKHNPLPKFIGYLLGLFLAALIVPYCFFQSLLAELSLRWLPHRDFIVNSRVKPALLLFLAKVCSKVLFITGWSLTAPWVVFLLMLAFDARIAQASMLVHPTAFVLYACAIVNLLAHSQVDNFIQTFESAEVQQLLAGKEAEAAIAKLVKTHFTAANGWATFENSLFVFNAGMQDEWSTEVDLIVVGARAIYLIEAKYKSGTVQAHPDEDEWTVVNGDRTSTMRNALRQVRKQCNALENNLKIEHARFIPIVAFYGKQLQVHGPSNVVAYERLPQVILSFENGLPSVDAHDCVIAADVLAGARTQDAQAMERHIARAQDKQAVEGHQETVRKAVL